MATEFKQRVKSPLIVIVGPTASGKSSVALELAALCRGEIICADSRTVYKSMDIGTAKPSKEERAAVPHWGLDLVEPNEAFTAAAFKTYATTKIEEIRTRGNIPIVVGGTGLYVDSILFDYQFGPPPNQVLRGQLEAMTLEQLQEYCIKNNIALPENKNNRRYVVRAIEQGGINRERRRHLVDMTHVVGIATDSELLRARIAERTEQLFLNGVVDEATILGEKYGWDSEAMTGNIYPLIRRHLESELTLDEVKQLFLLQDWRLAKRQLTWLRRNPYIVWCTRQGVANHINTLLATDP